MRFEYSPKFKESYSKIPKTTQIKFAKQADFLLKNIRHPSLHAKKFDKARNIWQARVDRDYRFWFTIEDDVYILLLISKHPK